MLRALDLFSGIGGITYGLRGIVAPTAYVEKDPNAREFLQKKHPGIPVFDDVCTFDATSLKGNIDIITAGWPCTGFSTAGKGTGFSHEASGLFTEVVRLAKECEPKYLFLENSFILSKIDNLKVIIKSFDDFGYDCRWLTCRATNVGALHQRHRWFCLVSKRGLSDDVEIPHVDRFGWDNNQPHKQISKNTPENAQIARWLGNAVVPDQVRFAFTTLIHMDTTTLTEMTRNTKVGFSKNGILYHCLIKMTERPPLNIILHQGELPEVHNATTPVLERVIKKYWATPVFTQIPRGSTVLTSRCAKALGTQVRFCEKGVPGWYINCDWVTWLMGYPSDYFKV
ncbi:cytosine-specific methyltransferase [Acanthocystis turfacea Chlorella virus NE-JV-2]|nr:cytosine-specific methyltransferase [Acanthocystis turfacea Chlorella virus NE-JV-2]